MMTPTPITTLLRVEGLALLSVSVIAYAQFGSSWLLFGLLLFTPDIFMLGYLLNARRGAQLYNLGHTYLTPAALLLTALLLNAPLALAISIIWFAHIGLDRLLGYGLKLSTGFKHTHLSRA